VRGVKRCAGIDGALKKRTFIKENGDLSVCLLTPSLLSI